MMPRFSIKYPYFIVVCFLVTCVMGIVSLGRLPVDLFPKIKIPVVVVATFFNGMPPEQIETSITGPFERFFTLASGVDHIESVSRPGVSLIKIYFQPGVDADSAVTSIANLAMADLRRLPPGTLPPVVLRFDASSLPVCLVTLQAEGFDESKLRDLGQFNVRNQIANVPGAAVPQPFGGKYRQIMVYVDPLKLEAYQLSVMDIVRKINESNLILPMGDAYIGPIDYNLYSNNQLNTPEDINAVPLKTVGTKWVTVGDVGYAKDAAQIQTNIARIDGQRSVYLPILKQGGDSNTIEIVEGIKKALTNLIDVPKELIMKVVFDQSIFVKKAIENLIHEGSIGLLLTALMILLFLGSLRAMLGVFFSIPLSVLGTFAILALGDNSINAMTLGGLALVFSRLIDNSVVVLENIYRHLEKGETPEDAAERGGSEVALPVLAATLTTAIVFFPVTLFYGVSRYLFTALALSVVISLFVSYVVALTVVPLYCAKTLKRLQEKNVDKNKNKTKLIVFGQHFHIWFNKKFGDLLDIYEVYVKKALKYPERTVLLLLGFFVLSLGVTPFLGLSCFPRTDPGQFVINLKAPTGTRIEVTETEVKKVEDIIRRIVDKDELDVIASNIGLATDFSSIYSPNTASNTAFVQASLKEGHKTNSNLYLEKVRKAVHEELPQLTLYCQLGGLVDSVVNQGLPAPINIQITGFDLEKDYKIASILASKIAALNNVSDVFIPQDVNAPGLMLDIDRLHASELGLTQEEVVNNVITALASNVMIAPSYWFDPKTGNDYMLTVQYPEGTVKTIDDLKGIPLRAKNWSKTVLLDAVTKVRTIRTPTVVNHFQLLRVIDLYVATKNEDLSGVAKQVNTLIQETQIPENMRITVRGSVEAMHATFHSFAIGLILCVILVYLVLVAQFRSFSDPFLILLAIPPGLTGSLFTLVATGTTLNVMSLMGIVMLVGISVSNSILIVDFTHRLRAAGMEMTEAVAMACRVRLRPVLMTSLATIIGLLPLSLSLGAGSEVYAPLARVIIGGLFFSVLLTVFLVPAAYLWIYRPPGGLSSYGEGKVR